ncbi:hypothetical protein BATDEDRAFT_22205 [Batrachochytrium dendrobatidis JAM81]|uniref:LIM zinc-binding domain-containing protein n=1 Tax=Batrachochytrium dendrobatidis (strain JAM81 / FGSC 10211) TaxID=684364 RepID=F4NT09_BATDJ|nr:uncharacterized protein BATDEDRAFT_22205 [Batrachochytrium dendrobatidis JAM81]EGF83479.1 hypothetical protein BATDEDRAFT_22205 [Batrachochytrium dendrobatidis JAM81]|eukprot:XP_006675498.1 hypothetical protein BATDEDRAFT_22205 [Batrachochytrium dendrobatidis JAM81]
MDELDELQASLAKDLSCVGIADFKGHCFKCKGEVVYITNSTLASDEHQTHLQPTYQSQYLEVMQQNTARMGFDIYSIKHALPVKFKTDGKQFHPKCFCCSTCQKQLVSTFIEKDGSFVCKECYEVAFLPLCHGCNLRILPEKGAGTIVAVEWKDKKYHQACFSCKNCRKPFEDLKAVAHNDYLYCKECFEDEATRNAS